MAISNFEESIKYGIERALYQPIANGLSVFEWAKIGMNSPRWISVKDRPPEEDGLYNVYCKDGSMAHAWFEDKWFIDHCECGDGYVTHWAPLLKPPEESA